MKGRLALILLFITAAMGCKKSKPIFDIIPYIDPNSVAVSNDSVQNGTTNSLINIKFSFTDGDGDIGSGEYPPASSIKTILYPDTLYPSDTLYFTVPDITPSGNNKAISGTIEFKVTGIFYPPNPSDFPITIYFSVVLFDRAGHMSNTVTTSTVLVYL